MFYFLRLAWIKGVHFSGDCDADVYFLCCYDEAKSIFFYLIKTGLYFKLLRSNMAPESVCILLWWHYVCIVEELLPWLSLVYGRFLIVFAFWGLLEVLLAVVSSFKKLILLSHPYSRLRRRWLFSVEYCFFRGCCYTPPYTVDEEVVRFSCSVYDWSIIERLLRDLWPVLYGFKAALSLKYIKFFTLMLLFCFKLTLF